MLATYPNLVSSQLIHELSCTGQCLLNQVACLDRFQGFFLESAHLERAMAFHAALELAGHAMLKLEAARRRRYSVVAWSRPDHPPSVNWWLPFTKLADFENGPPRMSGNQTLNALKRAAFEANASHRFKAGCHSGNMDRGRIFPRSDAEAAFFGAMQNYRTCDNHKYNSAEHVIDKITPHKW